MIIKHCTKFQVSMISHLRREVSTRYFTLHPSWIHHNSKKNHWILLFWRYAHLLIIIKHSTKFQITMISLLIGEVSTRFVTDRLTESTKTICFPQDGGNIILCMKLGYHCYLYCKLLLYIFINVEIKNASHLISFGCVHYSTWSPWPI